jgi:hypothetical protein
MVPFRGGKLECVSHACPGVRNEGHTGRQASSLTWMTEIAKAGLVTSSIGGTGLRTCEAPRLLNSEIQDWRCRVPVGEFNLKGGAEFVELKFLSVGNTALGFLSTIPPRHNLWECNGAYSTDPSMS